MMYGFLRVLATMALKAYYRRIYISGLENLPRDKPIFIAANHPNGFTEPLLLACFLPRILHFLVRGDMFRKSWLKPILIGTNQIPIFRSKDGFANLRNNAETFKQVEKAISNNQAILIFVEGTTKLGRGLRPLQKGMARMALRTQDKIKDIDIDIIPIGINYSDFLKFRRDVNIKIGPPIKATNFKHAYSEDNVKSVNDLTNVTFDELDKLVVRVPASKDKAYEDNLEAMQSTKPLFKTIYKSDDKFKEEVNLAERINVTELNLESGQRNTFLLKILLFPFALIGLLVHYLPGLLVVKFADSKVSSPVFLSAIRISVGVPIFFFFYLVGTIVTLCLGKYFFLGWCLSIFSGIVYLWWRSV